jgi:peptide/nickel transport system substrate-binding protein
MALPDGPGYRLVAAFIRRDWRAIGVNAVAVRGDQQADLRIVDAVAAANLGTWYLRRFSCGISSICSPEADATLETARTAPTSAERQALLASADRALTDVTAFIPLAAPVRWSLVSPRLTGFQPNPAGRRFLGSLVAARRRAG